MTTTAWARATAEPGHVAATRFHATNAVAERFFSERVDDIARACQAMAVRFQEGGQLLVAGDCAQRSDVAHVVVEFLHPVVTGKRALPTLALPDMAGGSAERAVGVLSKGDDILLVLVAGALDASVRSLLTAARARGMLTMVLGGGGRSEVFATIDHHFVVPSCDACIVQETHEVLYHVLWELVHVFFEHRAVKP